jgi:phosphoribosylamine---glycine ligase
MSSRPRPEVFRPDRGLRAARGFQGLLQGLLRAPRHPDGGLGRLHESRPRAPTSAARGAPIVVKADGLAAGKGVVVAETVAEAEAAPCATCSRATASASAGARVVVEEFLAGEEASFIAMVDGAHILPLASSQDHKARDDGDRGSEHRRHGRLFAGPGRHDGIARAHHARGHEPTVAGLPRTARRTPASCTPASWWPPTARPGARVQLPVRRSRDPADPVPHEIGPGRAVPRRARRPARHANANGIRAALGVVLAAAGYPDDYRKGDPISGLDADAGRDDVKIFHAGTRLQDGDVVTSGGRVLCAVALGATWPRRNAKPTRCRTAFTGKARSAGATSAGAPSPGNAPTPPACGRQDSPGLEWGLPNDGFQQRNQRDPSASTNGRRHPPAHRRPDGLHGSRPCWRCCVCVVHGRRRGPGQGRDRRRRRGRNRGQHPGLAGWSGTAARRSLRGVPSAGSTRAGARRSARPCARSATTGPGSSPIVRAAQRRMAASFRSIPASPCWSARSTCSSSARAPTSRLREVLAQSPRSGGVVDCVTRNTTACATTAGDRGDRSATSRPASRSAGSRSTPRAHARVVLHLETGPATTSARWKSSRTSSTRD